MPITYKLNIPKLLKNNPNRRQLLRIVPPEVREEIRRYELTQKSYKEATHA